MQDTHLLMQVLVDCGVDINRNSINNNFTLYYTIAYGDLDFSKLLLDNGARPNFINDHNRCTALYYASINCNRRAMKMLLEYDAAPGFYNCEIYIEQVQTCNNIAKNISFLNTKN